MVARRGPLPLPTTQKIASPFNAGHEVIFLPLNDEAAVEAALNDTVAAIIIEGIQGVAGIHVPHDSFLRFLEKKCKANGSLLILDEIQSGYGRTGKFFSHQYAGSAPRSSRQPRAWATGSQLAVS